MMPVKLRIAQSHHAAIQRHLFPGDSCEAVVVALCGRRRSHDRHMLTVQEIVPIPYDECKARTPERVTWSTERMVPLLKKAAQRDLAILKIHSHPTGFTKFSSTDDASDKDLFNSVFGWTDSEFPHASAVMLPDGSMFGRACMPDGSFEPLSSIMVPGDDIHFWTSDAAFVVPEFAKRNAQLFGEATTQLLSRMTVVVVGASGTGSPTVEQVVRLGFGRVVSIDHDHVEHKNLNRIVNATKDDADKERDKVEVMKRAVDAMGLGTVFEAINEDLASPIAVKAVAEADIVIGCMDGVEGRHLLNRLCAFYVLPYFDIGVKLVSDGKGGISEAVGAVHYVKPDGSTLLDRGVYPMEMVKAEGLKRTDPKAYGEQLKVGYVHGVAVDRPAVISINMQMSSTAVNEVLARLHPYRLDSNAESAIVRVSFVQAVTYREKEGAKSEMFTAQIGWGDVKPLLNMPELSEEEEKS